MRTYHAQATAIIDAAPAHVYEIIADYLEGHQAILPRRYFKEMRVLAGGRGAGTIVAIEMNVFGTQTCYTMQVSEPEPGRVLREEDAAVGTVSTFTVDPVNGNTQSRVTIATTAQAGPGIMGWLEQWTTPSIMRRIFREELAQLNVVAKHSAPTGEDAHATVA